MFQLVSLTCLAPFLGSLAQESPAFEVHLDFEAPAMSEALSPLMELTWKLASETIGLKERPEEPLDVYLYRTIQAYEDAEQVRTGGRFRRNLAFSHHQSRSSHIALQPPLSEATWEVFGLPYQSARLLAHEASHLVVYQHMANFEHHPGWFAEGLACSLERRILQEAELLGDPGEDPFWSNQMLTLRKAAEADELPGFEVIVKDQGGKLDFSGVYALRWLWWEFLTEEYPKELQRFIDGVRRLGGSNWGFTERTEKAFRDAFSKRLRRLDKEWKRYVLDLEPRWDEVYRSLETFGDAWHQASFDKNAMAWRMEDSGRSYRLSGQLVLLPAANQQMNVLLGRSDEGFVQLAWNPGSLTVFHYHSKENRWERLADVEVPKLQVNQPFAFEVHARKGRELEVRGAGKALWKGRVDADLTGPYGLGALARSAGIWSKVELRRE